MSNKQQLARLLAKSIDIINDSMDSENEQIRFSAARYVIDQVLGKPTQRIEDDTNRLMAGTAAALSQTLREVLTAPRPTPTFNTVEGTVHILPPGDTLADRPLAPESKGALVDAEDFPE